MIDLWNSDKLSFGCLFLVRLAIVTVVFILAVVFSFFSMFLIVWLFSSGFGWVLIPISTVIFLYYVMGKIFNQI